MSTGKSHVFHRDRKNRNTAPPSTVSVRRRAPVMRSGWNWVARIFLSRHSMASSTPSGAWAAGSSPSPRRSAALVVGAVHRKAGPVQLVEKTPRGGGHQVDTVPGFFRGLVVRGGGQVLNERPAQGHVERLHPPADAQHGLARLEEPGDQLQLRLVSHQVRGAAAPVLLAVAGGGYVPAAREEQAVAGAAVLQVQGADPPGPRRLPGTGCSLSVFPLRRRERWFSWEIPPNVAKVQRGAGAARKFLLPNRDFLL